MITIYRWDEVYRGIELSPSGIYVSQGRDLNTNSPEAPQISVPGKGRLTTQDVVGLVKDLSQAWRIATEMKFITLWVHLRRGETITIPSIGAITYPESENK